MMKVSDKLCTQKYTYVKCENKKKQKFNAPHHFKVYDSKTHKIVSEVNFQEGPIKENGVNGVANEDLILMVITRLQAFQKSPYACEDNENAIKKLKEALTCLRHRTMDREKRKVEGTSKL